jgi:hypothetical protein
MYENENYLKIIVYLLGIGGVLSGVIGGLIAYIFREHVKDNNNCFSKNDHEHERFEDKIEGKADKK